MAAEPMGSAIGPAAQTSETSGQPAGLVARTPGKLVVALSPIINAVSGLVVTAVLVKLLPYEYFGLYINWIYAASILSIVCSLGFPAANAYLAARYPRSLAVIYGQSLAASLTIGVAGGLVLLWYIRLTSGDLRFPLLLLTPIVVPLTVAQSSINGALLGAGKHFFYAFVSGLQSLLNVALCSALLFLPFTTRDAFGWAVLVYVAASAAALITNLLGMRQIAAPNTSFFRKSMVASVPLWFHSVCTILLQRSDVMVLSHLLPPAEVGMYALASKLAEALIYIPQGFSLALFADMARNEIDGALRVVGPSIRGSFFMSLAAVVPVYFVFTDILPVFVPSAAKISGLLPLMLVAAVFLGPVYLLCSFAQAIGKPRDVLAITAVAVAAKLAILLVFTFIGGLKATPVALLFASVIAAAFAVCVAARRANVSFWSLLTALGRQNGTTRRLFRIAL